MKLPVVRLVLALSLDGRLALARGGKSSLGGKGDRKALERALAWSDATLIGGGTLRAHKNICLIHDKNLIKKRKEAGKASQPISIVVTKKAVFSEEWEYFKQPIRRILLRKKLKNNLLKIEGFNNSYLMKETWSKTLCDLYQKGFSKIALLGGIELIESILLEDNIDELQLTLTPRIVGGRYTWIKSELTNIPKILTGANAWIVKEMIDLGKSEIMLSYKRNRL